MRAAARAISSPPVIRRMLRDVPAPPVAGVVIGLNTRWRIGATFSVGVTGGVGGIDLGAEALRATAWSLLMYRLRGGIGRSVAAGVEVLLDRDHGFRILLGGIQDRRDCLEDGQAFGD